MRTVKSAAKRIQKITSNDVMLANRMSAQHRRKGKSKRAKRESHQLFEVHKGDQKKLRRMLPYGVE
jgi:ribosomal protein L35